MTTPRTVTIAELQVEQLVVGSLSNNVFLISDAEGHRLLVDAAAEGQRLLEWLDGRKVDTIVTTHRHHDHIGALAELARETGARVVAGRPDAEAIEQATGVPCEGLWTGDRLELGAHAIEVIGLVGHTPGGIALVVQAGDSHVHLFTGDSLFPGGVGKTHSPAEFTRLLGDVTTQLFERFDDQTVVHPGHGDDTTLGAERPHLDEWRQRGW